MKETISLFKSVLVSDINKTSKNPEFVKKCIKEGFIFTDNIFGNFSDVELERLFNITKKEFGLNSSQMNSSFHKSWEKVKNADIVDLMVEQLLHYYTTYGFESLGIYNKDLVFIPSEDLDIPELTEDIGLTVIKGINNEELKSNFLRLVNSGIALKTETIDNLVEVANLIQLSNSDIYGLKNKELKIILYDRLKKIPQDPTEFLRYLIFKATEGTLIIKNKETIDKIKERKNTDIINLFKQYGEEYGLDSLSTIFYRFKPLWLAFRTNDYLKHTINVIRRMAIKNHKPMQEDFLNTITSKLNNNETLSLMKLDSELKEVNIFRKIRLAYALQFRKSESDSILYKVRNGKGYAKDFKFNYNSNCDSILNRLIDSIIGDIKPNIKNKNIYIPENIIYALPSTEKQFTGMIPSGSYVKVPNDMIFGINWNNIGDHRIDLDLSLINTEGKTGWDSYYRSSNNNILFSGDLTTAPGKNGASELFYVSKQIKSVNLMFLNYFNYDKDIQVPAKIFIAKNTSKKVPENYVVDPNNLICSTPTVIDKQQKVLGIIITNEEDSRFYFSEINIGKGITSTDSEYSKHTREFLKKFYTNSISLNEILIKAGAKLCENKEDADIDLSPESLSKNTILDLL